MKYWLHETFAGKKSVYLHEESCPHCNMGEGVVLDDKDGVYGKWHGPYDDSDSAVKFAESLEGRHLHFCNICQPKTHHSKKTAYIGWAAATFAAIQAKFPKVYMQDGKLFCPDMHIYDLKEYYHDITKSSLKSNPNFKDVIFIQKAGAAKAVGAAVPVSRAVSEVAEEKKGGKLWWLLGLLLLALLAALLAMKSCNSANVPEEPIAAEEQREDTTEETSILDELKFDFDAIKAMFPSATFVGGKLSIPDVSFDEFKAKFPQFESLDILRGLVPDVAFKEDFDKAAKEASEDVAKQLNTEDHTAFIVGNDNGTFNPDDEMTRAAAVAIFYSLMKDKTITDDVSFSDVADGAWYRDAVRVLASKGIVKGVSDTEFHPMDTVTRAQFASIAMNFTNVSGVKKEFADVPQTHWAYDYIGSTAGYGWLDADEQGNFRPDDNITRADVVKAVNKMLNRAPDKAFIDENIGELKVFPDVPEKTEEYYQIIEATNAHKHNEKDGAEIWEK